MGICYEMNVGDAARVDWIMYLIIISYNKVIGTKVTPTDKPIALDIIINYHIS